MLDGFERTFMARYSARSTPVIPTAARHLAPLRRDCGLTLPVRLCPLTCSAEKE
jgi:hypothetical protein